MASMTSAFRVSCVALFGLLGPIACADDPIEIPESRFGEPVCMVAASYGHWEDGRKHFILDEAVNLAPAGCACVDPDERHDWTPDTRDMLAELTLDACERMAEVLFDFDWNDCEADYEAEAWETNVFYVGEGSDWAVYRPRDLQCIDAQP